MLPLLLCLIASISIIILKIIEFRKSKVNIAVVSIRIMNQLKRKEIEAAIRYCTEVKTPISNIIRRGLKKLKFGRKRVLEAIDTGGKIEINKLERGLTALISIAMTTPMLGLLGSIIGIIYSLRSIQALSQSASIAHLAGAVWENLIPSAFGLLIGIPVFAFYSYFNAFIKKNVFEMERVATDLIDTLDGEDKDEDEEVIKDEEENPEESGE